MTLWTALLVFKLLKERKVFATNSDFATHYLRSLVFYTINSARTNNLSLKYQRFAPSDGKNIRIGKFEFVTTTQFLCLIIYRIGLSSVKIKLHLWFFKHLICMKKHQIFWTLFISSSIKLSMLTLILQKTDKQTDRQARYIWRRKDVYYIRTNIFKATSFEWICLKIPENFWDIFLHLS